MTINLVSLVSQFLPPQLVGSLARAAGVNEAVAQKLAAAAIPTILAALATAAAAPGGAQKLADTVSNSDPDLLSKLTGAIGGGNVSALSEGANLLGGLLGKFGLSSIVGALSQYAGAPHGAAQSVVGAVTQAVVGTIGQQDPSNWSDASSIASMLSSQKSAIAALPPELSKALGSSGLLTGFGTLGAAAAQTASTTVSSAASTASATAASSAANRAQAASSSNKKDGVSDIFISYAKEDRPRAEMLAQALKARGWSVFWDRTIPIGKTWREVIEKELQNARCLIVL